MEHFKRAVDLDPSFMKLQDDAQQWILRALATRKKKAETPAGQQKAS